MAGATWHVSAEYLGCGNRIVVASTLNLNDARKSAVIVVQGRPLVAGNQAKDLTVRVFERSSIRRGFLKKIKKLETFKTHSGLLIASGGGASGSFLS